MDFKVSPYSGSTSGFRYTVFMFWIRLHTKTVKNYTSSICVFNAIYEFAAKITFCVKAHTQHAVWEKKLSH